MDRTVMQLACLDAWTGCVVWTMKTKMKRGRQRQTQLPTLHRSYLRRAMAGVLKVA